MKKQKRFLCLLLALVMLLSLLPLHALASEDESPNTGDQTTTDPNPGNQEEEEKKPTKGTVTVQVVIGSKTVSTYTVSVGSKSKTIKPDTYIKHNKKYYEFSYATISGKKVSKVTVSAFDSDNASAWQTKWGKTIKFVYKSHSHKYKFGHNRIYHWDICDCGHTINEVRHVDPATDTDKVCTCGYQFSNNADLTTLWLTNMLLDPGFSKETTDYIGNVRTYLDVKSTTITAKPFDALATVEVPENTEIHEGANKFVIKVTAEDKTTTKTYTVIAIKPVKVGNSFVSTDGTTVSATVKAPAKNKIATASVSEAVAAKVLEMAAQDETSVVCFVPEFSKWSVNQVELTLLPEQLTAIAEKTEAALSIKTPYESTLNIPRDQLLALAKCENPVTFIVKKDNTYDIITVGDPIAASQDITLTVPEK